MTQNYDNYYKKYYEINKEKILENSQTYRKRYAKEYYWKNRAKILEKLRVKRQEKKG